MADENKPILDTRNPIEDGRHDGEAPESRTTPPFLPSGDTSTATKTTTPISFTAPAQHTASSYEDLIPLIKQRMAEYKPLTDEELKKLRRRQKAQGIIAGIADAVGAISNLFFTTQYAPNMYNAKEGMSAKAMERFEKEKAQRQADDDKFLNYALTIGRLKDADKDRGLRVWQMEQSLARQDRAYDDGRKDRADDIEFRNKDYDERVRQWQAGFDRDAKRHEEDNQRWERQFKESVRQFNVSSANERARINMEGQRLAQSLKEGQMTFNLGSGHGNVTLTMDKLNAQTVSRIYHTLPDTVRKELQGEPIVKNGFVVGYKPPTTEAMLIAIGANVETSPATQNAIKQVAGIEKGNKPKLY